MYVFAFLGNSFHVHSVCAKVIKIKLLTMYSKMVFLKWIFFKRHFIHVYFNFLAFHSPVLNWLWLLKWSQVPKAPPTQQRQQSKKWLPISAAQCSWYSQVEGKYCSILQNQSRWGSRPDEDLTTTKRAMSHFFKIGVTHICKDAHAIRMHTHATSLRTHKDKHTTHIYRAQTYFTLHKSNRIYHIPP